MSTDSNKKSQELKISGDWSQQVDHLKSKFPQLTDADLKFELGKEEDLVNRLEVRLHKSKEEVIKMIRKTQTATV
mgnify:CR=1 FL=1